MDRIKLFLACIVVFVVLRVFVGFIVVKYKSLKVNLNLELLSDSVRFF